MSATPPRIQGPAPKAGQHTAELIARLNGARQTNRAEASTGELPRHPFEGVTVLDLSTVIAGPLGDRCSPNWGHESSASRRWRAIGCAR